jgi:UDP-N-acetyl-D-glucosamine dehydrogenase
MSYVLAATDQIARHLRGEQLVILESTTYPGTTEELIQARLEEAGWTVGRDLFLAFSPERVDPGNKEFGVRNTPKVVGGVTPECTELAAVLYRHTVETVVPVSSAAAAEMVKLLENTFRSVNIGLVNEIAIMADKLGIDVWEVIDAAATKPFGFMPFYPGPGLGGHCIPIDPFYLSWKLKTLDYRARFIELAGEVNSEMPLFIVGRLTDALNDRCRSVRGSRVLVLGVAYKRDIDDVRESPALDILRVLRSKGAEVSFCDPHVPSLRLNGEELRSVEITPAVLREQDCVVVCTDHAAFDYEEIVEHAPLVFDTRNATRPLGARDNIVRL